MRIRWLSLVTLAAVSVFPSVAESTEQHMKFLQGLRDKDYYDYALFYLDRMQAGPDTPSEFRKIIPYEKALTLMGSARTMRNAADQTKALDQALAYLDQFAKEHPQHELAGQANSEQARILLSKAQVEIWQSRSPSNQDGRSDFQERARGFIGQARDIFQTAHDQHETSWKKFKSFIDKDQEPVDYEARRQAEQRYIRAQLDLAKCSYWFGQSFDLDSEDYKKALTTASLEFETIHTRYRTMVWGLMARTWQGKCFEEQDDINKALGIYNELLGHPGKMELIKNQSRQFRLICLNHDDRRDFQIAIGEATQWLGENRSNSRSQVGLAIRWERAVAQEKMADTDRALKASGKERLLRDALDDVKFINRYPGQYKDLSLFKMRQLMAKLNKGDQDPRDFDSALGIARDMVTKQIKKKREALDAAKKAGKSKQAVSKLTSDYKDHLVESARILNLARSLVENDTPIAEINEARYLLSYVYYLRRMNYESAILGEFIATHYRNGDSSQLAQDAAYLAMAAYIQAFHDSPSHEQEIDMRLIKRTSDLIVSSWPNSDRANDARMQLARVYTRLNRPAAAAAAYSQIPDSSPQYASAQLQAGQSFWSACLEAPQLPEEQKPSSEELEKWKQAAQKHLLTGIDKTQKAIPTTGSSPDDLIAGKLSMAFIYTGQGQYSQSIALLTGDPHAVTAAIGVTDESKRPPDGVKSLKFASAVYQALLRAYVGAEDLDKARATMKSLEDVVAGSDGGGEALTEIYKDLGRALKQELQLLKAAGNDTRAAEVRNSFEKFLEQMYQRKDQTYNSLVWIAETYFGLGQGTEDDKQQAATYFEKAGNSYQTILDRVANGSLQGIDPSHLTIVKLRLITCNREEGDFEQALKFASELLAARPKSLNVQIESAHLYQAWADSGQGDSWKKFHIAIIGAEVGNQKAPMWGWGNLALRLQRLLAQGGVSGRDREQYELMRLNARYNSIYCRQQYGLAQSNSDKRKDELDKAKMEILAFASICGEISTIWWDKFDALYRQVQTDLGDNPVVALVKPQAIPSDTQNARTGPTKTRKANQQVAGRDQSESSNVGMIAFAVILFGGGGVGIYFMVKSQTRRPSVAYAANVPPTFIEPKRPARGKRSSGTSPASKARPRPKPP